MRAKGNSHEESRCERQSAAVRRNYSRVILNILTASFCLLTYNRHKHKQDVNMSRNNFALRLNR